MLTKDSKIAVVGGGLSGLVIASGLVKKGYKNVTVLERENRLGGKLHTIWYKGNSYELGGIFGLPVQKNLKNLMKEFNIKIDGPNLSRVNYDRNGKKIMQIPKAELGNFLEEVDRLPEVLEEYKSLGDISIRNIEEGLMLPFSAWCDIHKFGVIKKIYTHHYTSYGLGDIDTVPALYVLRILNFDAAMSFMEFPEYLTWKHGVSSFIERIGQTLDDLRLGHKVNKISFDGKVIVHTQFGELEFDGIIITAPIEQFPSVFHDRDNDLKELLRHIKYQDYNVYAFAVDKLLKGSGCILENLDKKNKGHILIWNSRWDTDNESLLTVYAYNQPDSSRAEALKIIKEDLLRLGIKNPRLHQFKSWRQCPYVEPEGLKEGFYDKMEAIQGRENVYIAGEIMSTATMEKCIRYSKYLLNKYF